ncbi:putative small secreted protein [Peteryoungia aggregata LMG 23059]|uniref:Small secreted protein n=1 Tax=Peteryoungia aggregata LMG 23059 TaxID=1368425 RepID=A0ABU0GCF5_9HYPH|nr:entericidin [Peteryoungia aggregata]MDQ0423012.1 putative small secreted protein [Peteryoungia aggregata LMG 23059]
MMAKKLTASAALVLTVFALSSCGNTIRGVGQDAANTVDATQNAANNVDAAASR